MIENWEDRLQKIKYIFLSVLMAVTGYILYKTYQYFNLDYKINQIATYNKDLSWKPMPDCWYDDKLSNSILADFFVCSSANTPFVNNLKYDYLHTEAIKKVLMAGARFIEFTVIGNDLSDNPSPVVSNGQKVGQWQSTLNNIPFEEMCLTVKRYAFQPYIDENQQPTDNKYPLIVYLNIEVYHKSTLDTMSNIIKKMWGDNLLDSRYHYSSVNLAVVPICHLFNKIIIIANNGFEDSELDKYINYNKLKRLHFNEISTYNFKEHAKASGIINSKNDEKMKEDLIKDPLKLDVKKLSLNASDIGKDIITAPDVLTEYTKENLVLVYANVPDDVQMVNYDFTEAMSYGCQLVTMNFRLGDEHIKKYIEVFKKEPFVLKNYSLRLDKTIALDKFKFNEIKDNFMDKVARGYDLLFKHKAFAIHPVIKNTVYFKPNVNNRQLISSVLPKPNLKVRNNSQNYEELDLFVCVSGINNKSNTYSFKSLKYPRQYLVHLDGLIQLEDNDQSAKFANNASFYIIPDEKKDDTKTIIAIQIVPYLSRDMYVRYTDESLIVTQYDGSPTFKDETQFILDTIYVEKYYSFRDFKGRYIRIIDGGFLTSNSPQITSETKFKVDRVSGKGEYYSIRASNGKYLSYDYISSVRAIADDVTDSEKFVLEQHNNIYAIRTQGDVKQRTFYAGINGKLLYEYDNIVIKGAVFNKNNEIVKDEVVAPELDRRKYFYLITTYGIPPK
jgi:hypothetical protein